MADATDATSASSSLATLTTLHHYHHAGMKGQGQKEHFTLGAEVRDFSTSGFQPDHLAARSVEDKLAEAADKRLLGFTKKNMQVCTTMLHLACGR